MLFVFLLCFFFNDTATTEIYTLSLHDALPISWPGALIVVTHDRYFLDRVATRIVEVDRGKTYSYEGNYEEFLLVDRKSTRLNSSHSQISYAVFCLKKKKKINIL